MYKKKRLLNKLLSCVLGCSFVLTACNNTKYYKILANYNGQADVLLSLQITPDYYPYQFQEKSLRDYIKNPQKYVLTNNNTSQDKAKLKSGIQKRFTKLLSNVKTFDKSLWNNAIYTNGRDRNTGFWTSKDVDLMFMERFVLDDYKDEKAARPFLPASKYIVQTNFRASRDPFTTFSKEVYDAFNSNLELNAPNLTSNQKIGINLREYFKKYSQDEPNALYRYGSYMDFWSKYIEKNKDVLTSAGFYNWIKNYEANHTTRLFNQETESNDQNLAKLYEKVILDKEQTDELKKWSENQKEWHANYLEAKENKPKSEVEENKSKTETEDNKPKAEVEENNSKTETEAKTKSALSFVKSLHHHPAFEQQADPGSSPAAEGSQRDNMVYLYQVAIGIYDYVNKNSKSFDELFKEDWRYDSLKSALKNTSLIGKNFQERLKSIREYLQKIGVVDANYMKGDLNANTKDNSKIFSIVTISPSTGGEGNSTIQTSSKFAFIYNNLGLKQPLPLNPNNNQPLSLDYNQPDSVKYAGFNKNASEDDKGNELFNIDDNGWWWNLGNGDKFTANLKNFYKTSDTVLFTATDPDWTLYTSGPDHNTKIRSLMPIQKDYKSSDKLETINQKNQAYFKQPYNLWNEGLRSPFSLNMVLDRLVDIFTKQYNPDLAEKTDTAEVKHTSADIKKAYSTAMDWGNYWTDYFIQGQNFNKLVK